MLPKKLYNFNVFFDGNPMAGVVEEITLPTLERQTEDYRGAGMLGPVKLDLGLSALTLDFTMAEFNADVLGAWGLADMSGIGLRFLGETMSDDAASSDAIELSVRGRVTKFEPGSAKGGELTKPKVEMALTYYKFSVNGEAKLEIDLIGATEVVNGTDRSAAMLKALGLAAAS